MPVSASRKVTLGLGALFLAVGWAGAAPAAHRVCFNDGRCIEAAEISYDAGQALLRLPDGNAIAFPSSRIGRIEPIERIEPPRPAQDAAPATPAPAPAAAEPKTESIESMILAAASKHGIEPDLLAAVIAVESGYRPDAVSPKGAQGLMQLMPATARELEVKDPLDPRQNIEGGARYLRQLLDDNDGVYWRALAAYNAGMGRVARYDGLPPYRETINYIRRVFDRYGSNRLAVVADDSDR